VVGVVVPPLEPLSGWELLDTSESVPPPQAVSDTTSAKKRHLEIFCIFNNSKQLSDTQLVGNYRGIFIGTAKVMSKTVNQFQDEAIFCDSAYT